VSHRKVFRPYNLLLYRNSKICRASVASLFGAVKGRCPHVSPFYDTQFDIIASSAKPPKCASLVRDPYLRFESASIVQSFVLQVSDLRKLGQLVFLFWRSLTERFQPGTDEGPEFPVKVIDFKRAVDDEHPLRTR
jgi:hypothetical protein